jgi:hypothetical protein
MESTVEESGFSKPVNEGAEDGHKCSGSAFDFSKVGQQEAQQVN